MRAETVNIECFRFYGVPGIVDPVTVILEDMAPGAGRVIVECYGSAWSGYWGAMGNMRVREFFCDCGPDYLCSRMAPQSGQGSRSTQKWRQQVIEAAQAGLKQTAPIERDGLP